MKPDKKQLPQLIVLGVLALVCVGYVSFTVMSPKTPPPQAAKHAKKSFDETATDAVIGPDSATMGVFASLAVIPARRDPFMPQALPFEDLAIKQVANGQPVRKAPVNMSRVPGLGPMNPFVDGGGFVQPAKTEQEPTLTLTGVVRGERNVAIIRSGDTRYIVKQGQLINGRYRVLVVTDDGAVLAYKNRRMYMKLGGN